MSTTSSISMQTLIDSLPSPIFYKDLEGRYLGCNAAFEAYLGLSRNQIVGRTVYDLTPPELAAIYHAKDLELLTKQGSQVYQSSVPGADGTLREVLFNKATLQDDQGTVQGLVGVLVDITGLAPAGESLQAYRAFLEKILNSIPQTVFWKNRESVYLGSNEAFARRAGLTSAAQIVGKTDYDLPWLPEEAESYRQDDRIVMQSQQPKLHFIETQRQADGSRLWVDTSKLPLTDSDGRVYGVLGVYDDITERRSVEQRLAEELEVRRKLVAAAPVGVAVFHGGSGRCILCNDALAITIGGTVDQLMDSNFRTIASWKTSSMLETAERALAQASDQHLETRLSTAFGKEVWASCVFSTFQIGGEPHLLLLLSDITASHQAREALHKSATQYRMLTEKMGEGLIATDADGRYTYCNPRFLEMLGYRESEVLGKTFFDTSFQYDFATFRKRLKEREAHRSEQYETRLSHRDGTPVEVLVSAEPLFDERGEFTGTLGIITDIRERKRSEENLRRAQKIESLTMLACGIAHDFNNLFQTVQGNLEMAKAMLSDPTKAQRALDRALEGLQKASVLSQQMLDYSGKSSRKSMAVDLAALVRTNLGFLAELAGGDQGIQFQIEEGLPLIDGDPDQILQVLASLVTNAYESLTGQSRPITLALGFLPAEERGKGFWAETAPTVECLAVTVSDEGCGIPPEMMGKLFDPFYTTKEHGRGLELASALGILKGHQAGLQVCSEPGKGTTFRLVFPLRPTVAEIPARPVVPSARPSTGLILLVDDDEGVRATATEILREFLHYQVLEARDGEEAVATFRQHADSISLILMDSTMPRLGGADAFEAIRAIRPGARAILCSGYSDDTGHEIMKAHGFAGFLKKPYAIKDLKQMMDKVLCS